MPAGRKPHPRSRPLYFQLPERPSSQSKAITSFPEEPEGIRPEEIPSAKERLAKTVSAPEKYIQKTLTFTSLNPRNWYAGNLYYFKYLRWQHDPWPLVLAIGYNPNYHTLEGINLHYITPRTRRVRVVNAILRMWKARIGPRNIIQVSTNEVFRWAKHFYGYVFYRRYKIFAIERPTLILAFEDAWDDYVSKPKMRGRPFTAKELASIRRGIARILRK